MKFALGLEWHPEHYNSNADVKFGPFLDVHLSTILFTVDQSLRMRLMLKVRR